MIIGSTSYYPGGGPPGPLGCPVDDPPGSSVHGLHRGLPGGNPLLVTNDQWWPTW